MSKIRLSIFCFLLSFGTAIIVTAQEKSVDQLNPRYVNWHNKNITDDKMLGTGVDKVYREILPGKTAKKSIIVAIIDSGVDIDHEDLKGRIWTNEDEIPENNIDDDHNGYVDDIHGWNFIGNKNGQNLKYENLEITRIIKAGNGPYYAEAKLLYEKEKEKRLEETKNIARFEDIYRQSKAIILKKTRIDVNSLRDLDAVNDESQEVLKAKKFLSDRYERGFKESTLTELKKMNAESFNYYLNVDFSPRAIVGDDPMNISDKYYGNPDVKGPRADHGTSVAGVVAAIRDNAVGINGIATEVRIMVIRSTPAGDERDKDVALAIQYAVDNGANIINMSFGKKISPQKQFVDQAVKAAEAKNVLIIHSAGNEAANLDKDEYFPSDRYLDGTKATNWITIGASGYTEGDAVASAFSNYGQKHVDVFAPGENIVSADTTNTYAMHDGTSLSAPVVTGIAALVLSYYPSLTPQQMIALLIKSSYRIDNKVIVPGSSRTDPKKTKFTNLSVSGGIVSAYAAMIEAEKVK